MGGSDGSYAQRGQASEARSALLRAAPSAWWGGQLSATALQLACATQAGSGSRPAQLLLTWSAFGCERRTRTLCETLLSSTTTSGSLPGSWKTSSLLISLCRGRRRLGRSSLSTWLVDCLSLLAPCPILLRLAFFAQSVQEVRSKDHFSDLFLHLQSC